MMTLAACKRCLVVGCKRASEKMWTPMMSGKLNIPVCLFHYSQKLWWHKGTIFCRDEEEG